MHDHIKPFFHRQDKLLNELYEFAEKELLGNREVQKYLFLNQFELHNVYNSFLAEEYETDVTKDVKVT